MPFAAGGSSSIVARAFSAEMSTGLGQQFVVENKPGGGGNIAMEEVARADPDGYTLIIGHVGTLAMNPYLFEKLPYDANRDFRPIALFAKVPTIFVVHESVPAKNLREFVALPYRLHATKEQFEKAYPQARAFFAAKRRYDPDEIFQNEFYRKYGQP